MPVLKIKQTSKKMTEAEILESLSKEDTPKSAAGTVVNKPPASGRKKTMTVTEPKNLTPLSADKVATERVRSRSVQPDERVADLEDKTEAVVVEPKQRGRKPAGMLMRN